MVPLEEEHVELSAQHPVVPLEEEHVELSAEQLVETMDEEYVELSAEQPVEHMYICDEVKDKDNIIVCLRESCAADGVHFTDEGYATLSSNIHRSLESRFFKCCQSMSAAASVSGRGGRPGNFYWRGFMSPVGSTRPKNMATSYKHVRNNRLPPYARAQPERKNRGGHQRSARGRGRERY